MIACTPPSSMLLVVGFLVRPAGFRCAETAQAEPTVGLALWLLVWSVAVAVIHCLYQPWCTLTTNFAALQIFWLVSCTGASFSYANASATSQPASVPFTTSSYMRVRNTVGAHWPTPAQAETRDVRHDKATRPVQYMKCVCMTSRSQ